MTEKTKNALMLVKTEVVDVVAAAIAKATESRALVLPANYCAENALKSAWLILQNVVDRDKRPALEVCSRPSIQNALYDMVVQALNPVKKQCYFIVYGDQLACQRSYFGSQAVAKQVDPRIFEFFAEVVYEGDTFEYEINRGRRMVTSHVQKLANINPDKILAAYAIALDAAGEPLRCDIMTWSEVKHAWARSKAKPILANGNVAPGSTHDEHSHEMAKKSVMGRLCKAIINTSSDAELLKVANRGEHIAAQAEAEEEQVDANGEVIDVEMEPAATSAAPTPQAEEEEPDPPKPAPQEAEVQAQPKGAQVKMGF